MKIIIALFCLVIPLGAVPSDEATRAAWEILEDESLTIDERVDRSLYLHARVHHGVIKSYAYVKFGIEPTSSIWLWLELALLMLIPAGLAWLLLCAFSTW